MINVKNDLENTLQESEQKILSGSLELYYLEVEKKLSNVIKNADCSNGCYYCCYYHILVTPVEVFTIIEHMKTLSMTQRKKLIQKLYIIVETVSLLTPQEYIKTNVECVFLDSGNCSIYSIRPFACRRHNSCQKSICKVAYDFPDHPVENILSLFEIHNIVDYSQFLLQKLLLKKGYDIRKFELHSAIKNALEDSSTKKRWKKGKISFPEVKDWLPFYEE